MGTGYSCNPTVRACVRACVRAQPLFRRFIVYCPGRPPSCPCSFVPLWTLRHSTRHATGRSPGKGEEHIDATYGVSRVRQQNSTSRICDTDRSCVRSRKRERRDRGPSSSTVELIVRLYSPPPPPRSSSSFSNCSSSAPHLLSRRSHNFLRPPDNIYTVLPETHRACIVCITSRTKEALRGHEDLFLYHRRGQGREAYWYIFSLEQTHRLPCARVVLQFGTIGTGSCFMLERACTHTVRNRMAGDTVILV